MSECFLVIDSDLILLFSMYVDNLFEPQKSNISCVIVSVILFIVVVKGKSRFYSLRFQVKFHFTNNNLFYFFFFSIVVESIVSL